MPRIAQMKKNTRRMFVIAFIAVAVATQALIKAETNEQQKASYVGGEICLTCHSDYDAKIKGSKHAILFENEDRIGAKRACEACHGPGSLHVDGGGDVENIIRFTAKQGSERMCLECHKSGAVGSWRTSKHAEEGKTCSTCHRMHEKNETLLKASQPELCFQCHENKKGEMSLPSRHPVKEGGVSCADCHNPHSSLDVEYSGGSATSKCVSCHQERVGPFAYEHVPVAENCMACHSPHGSVNKNLLNFKQPTLCFSCHIDIVSNALHPPDYQTKRPSCANSDCHTSIHGSNNDSRLHW